VPRASGQIGAGKASTSAEERLGQALAKFHPHFLGFHAYFQLSEAMGGGLLEGAGVGAGNFLVNQLRNSNPLLGLAHTLALLAHGRAAWLTQRAVVQTDPRSLAVHLQGSERATHTFLKLLDAINENGQTKNPGTKISIGQANVAHQQVVQNLRAQKGNHDKQTGIRKKEPIIDAEIVSAVGEGPEIAASGNPQKSPLGPEHRPKNAGGKSTSFSERFNARREVRRQR
jgi:hypothetical protein